MSRSTARARATAFAAAGMVVAVAVVLVVLGPAVYDTRATSAEIQAGTDISSCRAINRTRVDDAVAAVQVANGRLTGLLPAALNAAIDDQDRLGEVLAEAEAASAVLDQALVELEAATSDYRELAAVAKDDPDRFLIQCEAGA